MKWGPQIGIRLRQIQVGLAALLLVMCSSCYVYFSDPLLEGDLTPVDLTPYLGDWYSARATNAIPERLTVTLHESELWVESSMQPGETMAKLRIARLGSNMVASVLSGQGARMKEIVGSNSTSQTWTYFAATLNEAQDRVNLDPVKLGILCDAVQSGELEGHAVFEDNVHTVWVKASQEEVRQFLEKAPDLFAKNFPTELEFKRVASVAQCQGFDSETSSSKPRKR